MSRIPADAQRDSAGESDLDQLMTHMSPVLDPRVYVFVQIDEGELSHHVSDALMFFREDEGVTLILDAALATDRGLQSTFVCRRITLQVHSSLHAVGFLAALLPVLAESGMGVNPVSGFLHDHLFLPADRAEQALAILLQLKNRRGSLRR